jgi:voltage-gated potassium channel Kch
MLKISKFEHWRFLQLTIFLIIFWIVFPLIGQKQFVQILTQLFVLNSILVVLSTEKKAAGIKKVVWALWTIGLMASLSALLPISPELKKVCLELESVFHFMVLMICISIILSVVFRSRRITLDGIFAAFVAYLLLAFAFGLIYNLLIIRSPDHFKGALNTNNHFGDAIYFSLVTIATLGYGDIVPATNAARTIATIEAVIGQFYVAVIVAVLVGLFISQRMESELKE